MKRIGLLLELLLLWLLPVLWLVFCFDVFRRWEPSEQYKNSMAYLFLAGMWLVSLKKLKRSLPAARARIWGGAMVLCVTALVTGLIFFLVFPFSWAFWPVFFAGLIVIASAMSSRSSTKDKSLV